MKKQIEIIEKSTKTIEVEVPSFYINYGIKVAITERSIIRVWDNSLISFVPSSEKERYDKEIADVVNDQIKPKRISQQEFETSFNNTIKCLTEQYQLSINMLDPNTQTAEGQEVAATESAAQDTAMEVQESAEEGSTEG